MRRSNLTQQGIRIWEWRMREWTLVSFTLSTITNILGMKARVLQHTKTLHHHLWEAKLHKSKSNCLQWALNKFNSKAQLHQDLAFCNFNSMRESILPARSWQLHLAWTTLKIRQRASVQSIMNWLNKRLWTMIISSLARQRTQQARDLLEWPL